MNDTTRMEHMAEDLISHKLLRSDIVVAKPKVDMCGADLIAFLKVSDDGAKFCRIQCKGRSVKNKNRNSNVKIYESYLGETFVVCLFIDDGDPDKTHLFVFFSKDIRNNWQYKEKNKEYVLNFSKDNFSYKLDSFCFNDEKIKYIKIIIQESDIEKEMKFFLPKATNIDNDSFVIDMPADKIVVKKGKYGINQSIIINKLTEVQSSGPACPGDPKDYEFNGCTWRLKTRF